MSDCEHKFRTNLDGLSLGQNNVTSNIWAKTPLSPYVTIIFCEKCGFVVHDSNNTSKQFLLNKKEPI